jgi:hypothetical protein
MEMASPKAVRTVTLLSVVLLASAFSSYGSTSVVTTVNAQAGGHTPEFTPTSAVVEQARKVWYVGAEALIPSPWGSFDLHFTLPPNAMVVRFQGTASWNIAATCKGDVLAQLHVGSSIYPLILKATGGAAQNTAFDYAIPIPTGDGTAFLHVEGNPDCPGTHAGMSSFEMQALIQVQ